MFWERQMIRFDQIIPTHNRLRHPERLWEIYQWNKSHGMDKPVVINRANKKYYIQDGHHRLVLEYWLSNLDQIANHRLTNYSAKDYKAINFDEEWVTPFDLEEWVRLPDFIEFKKLALKTRNADWIRASSQVYSEIRRVYGIYDLAKQYSPVVYVRENLETESEKSLALPPSSVYAMVRLENSNMTVAGATMYEGRVITSSLAGCHSRVYFQAEQAQKLVAELK